MKILISLFCLTLLASNTFAQQPTAETSAQQAPSAVATAAAADQTQPQSFAAGTIIGVELSKSVDAKKLKPDDPIEARTSVNMLSNGKIVMPRNTKVLGHVTSAKPHSKDSPDSMVGIAFDRLVMKDGHELPFRASVQAIGAPLNTFNSADAPVSPVSGMSGPAGGSSGGSPGSMGGSQRSGGGGSSPAPTYPGGELAPTVHTSSTGALDASSQGVIGLKDLTLSATPEASVVSSSSKNVHLDSGTQLILKVE